MKAKLQRLSKAIKKALNHAVDKRDLVNLDLYKHEIDTMKENLDALTTKPSSKKVHEQINELNNGLDVQRKKLDEFCSSYDAGKLSGYTVRQDHSEKGFNPHFYKKSEGFFVHLRTFENGFKSVREEVNDFIKMQSKTDTE